MRFRASVKKWRGLFAVEHGLQSVTGEADCEEEFFESVMADLALILHPHNIRFEVTIEELCDGT